MTHSTKNKVYFCSLLVVSVIWLVVFPKPVSNYAPLVFMLSTFPFFMFNYYAKLIDFSNRLKTIQPDLFQKHVVDYGYAFKRKIVRVGLFHKNHDFENLEDIALREMYLLCRQSLQLGLLSFVIFPVLGIACIVIGY